MRRITLGVHQSFTTAGPNDTIALVTGNDASEPECLQWGWTALREGQWERARCFFDAADAQAVFEAREWAFHGYRDAGDPTSAARMATWLAADQLDFNGALATASGWLERARRLLEPVGASAEHGWLAFHRGFVASIRGKVVEAEQLGADAARLGRESGVADLEMLGLALQGMSLVSRAEVERGMRCLDEASAFALACEATIPISSAWTCCFLVTACTRVLDFERAFEWCDRIAEFAERYGSRYMLGFCRAEYATIHLWRALGRSGAGAAGVAGSLCGIPSRDAERSACKPRRAQAPPGTPGRGLRAARSCRRVGLGAVVPSQARA
jgi:hypothetical protein